MTLTRGVVVLAQVLQSGGVPAGIGAFAWLSRFWPCFITNVAVEAQSGKGGKVLIPCALCVVCNFLICKGQRKYKLHAIVWHR